MPLTKKFINEYLKLLMHLTVIIVAFAVCFHFLLIQQSSFHTIWYSIVKTLVWMLGDLGYDDTFLDEENPVKYPILTNLLFVLFVTVIGWLAFNLIMTNPNESLDNIREKAIFHRGDAALKLQLLIDDCVPRLRRKFAVIKINKQEGSLRMLAILKTTKLYHSLSTHDSKYWRKSSTLCTKGDSELQDKMDTLMIKIDHIMKHLEIGNK